MILVDTNILLRIAQIGHPHRQPALDALQLLTLRDQERSPVHRQRPHGVYPCLRYNTCENLTVLPPPKQR
jgi:hypothetical protein